MLGSNKPMLLFNVDSVVIGSSVEYNHCLGVKSHKSVFNALIRKHSGMANQYVQQVRHICDTLTPITTFDFYRSTPQAPATIIKFNKFAITSDNQSVGVVFDGVNVVEADRVLTDFLRLPIAECESNDIKLNSIDAHLLLLIRVGYNSRQASEIVRITHKAANKRLERIMSQFGVTERCHLLEILRSGLVLEAVYGALVNESVSVEI